MASSKEQNLKNVRKVVYNVRKLSSHGASKRCPSMKDINAANLQGNYSEDIVSLRRQSKLPFKSPFKVPAKLSSISKPSETSSSSKDQPEEFSKPKASNIRIANTKTRFVKCTNAEKDAKKKSFKSPGLNDVSTKRIKSKETCEIAKDKTIQSEKNGNCENTRSKVISKEKSASENYITTSDTNIDMDMSDSISLESQKDINNPQNFREIPKKENLAKRKRLSLTKRKNPVVETVTIMKEEDNHPYIQLHEELIPDGKRSDHSMSLGENNCPGYPKENVKISPVTEGNGYLTLSEKFAPELIALVYGEKLTPNKLDLNRSETTMHSANKDDSIQKLPVANPKHGENRGSKVTFNEKTKLNKSAQSMGDFKQRSRKAMENKGCSRTLGCPQYILQRRDIDDFVLGSSFKQYRSNKQCKINVFRYT